MTSTNPSWGSAFRPGTKPMTFIAGTHGAWKIEHIANIIGETLPWAERLDVQAGLIERPNCTWAFRGVAGHARYVERRERGPLDEASPPLNRPEATKAAFIPMRKSPEWWVLTQDERRAIFEERSHHIELSMKYLPAIARGLYHCRDLGEPFDFIAWFEFAPKDAGAFADLLAELRATEEWTFVDREVEVRLER